MQHFLTVYHDGKSHLSLVYTCRHVFYTRKYTAIKSVQNYSTSKTWAKVVLSISSLVRMVMMSFPALHSCFFNHLTVNMDFIFEWSDTFYKQAQCVYLPCKNKIDIFVMQCPLCRIIMRSLRYSTTVTCVEWLVCSDGYNQLFFFCFFFKAGEDCCPVLWHEELPQLRGQACTGEDHRKITKEQINLLSYGLLWLWREKT